MKSRRVKESAAAVPGLRQETQFTCMATSMAACLQALGKTGVTEEQVNRVLGAYPMRGARWEEALGTAQYFGCRGTLVVPSTVEMLRDWTSRGIPVMIAWNPEGRPWSHASVVSDVSEDGATVTIMDPNIPDPNETFRYVSRSDFYARWYEAVGDSMMVRRPAMAVEREVSVKGTPMPSAVNRVASLYLKQHRGVR